MIENSVPQNRDVWRIAAPMILSNISVPLLGMVDTGVTGHLQSPQYLAAVAIGSAIFGVLYTGVNFLRMGTTGITAQRFGADDNNGLRNALGQAIVVALAIALVLIGLHWPIGRLGMVLIGAANDVRGYAIEYFNIRIWSAPATLLSYVLVGWFLGLQNARVPLIIVIVVNATNIVLDLVFVLLLGMDVAGVAFASVIAEYSGVIVGLLFALRALKQNPGTWNFEVLRRLREYAAFFAVNAQLFVRTMSLIFVFVFVTAQGTRMGTTILAANAVLMNLQNLTAFGLDGFAHAAEALVGKAIGSQRRNAFERAVALCLRWSIVFSAGFSLAYIIFGPGLVRLLTDLPGVRTTAVQYLPWLIVLPLVSIWSFLYDGVFVGATRARDMRNVMLISTFLVFLPCWYLLRPLGNHGLWLAFTLFMASRGIGMHVVYRWYVRPAVLGEVRS